MAVVFTKCVICDDAYKKMEAKFVNSIVNTIHLTGAATNPWIRFEKNLDFNLVFFRNL